MTDNLEDVNWFELGFNITVFVAMVTNCGITCAMWGTMVSNPREYHPVGRECLNFAITCSIVVNHGVTISVILILSVANGESCASLVHQPRGMRVETDLFSLGMFIEVLIDTCKVVQPELISLVENVFDQYEFSHCHRDARKIDLRAFIDVVRERICRRRFPNTHLSPLRS